MGKKIITARVLNIMQYEKHPKTNEELINENQIKSALEHKTIKQWAYIAHTEDVYTEDDELNNPDYKAGAKKPKHWHIVIRCDRAVELPVIAKWFGIEENYIEVAKGRGAFLDCVEYLTHESETQQALGKHLYSDKEVKANFDFRKELEDRESMILKYGRDLTPKDRMRYDVLYLGKTLKQCMNEDEILYMNDIEKLKKLRLEYISRQKVPSTRLNYYIAGQGGYGKDIASRALARSLFPQYEDDDDIFFEVGAKNATFEGYDGQPVIIWSEYRAFTLLEAFNGRENLFKVFDSHPHNSRVNIKFGSVKLINTVNIVNSVQDYQEFLDGLAGEYTDKSGNVHYAEDKGQSYRRFPIIMPLHSDDIDILFSKYFTGESDDPTEYEQWKRICGNFRRIRTKCRNNEKLARMLESRLLVDLPEKSRELLENEQIMTDEEILKEFEMYGSEIVELPLFDPKGEEEGETWSELMSGDIDLTELCEEKKAG